MKTTILSICLVFFLLGETSAQKKTQDFILAIPAQKIPGSLYSTITLLDSRTDTSSLGTVHLGLTDAGAKIIPHIPLAVQLQHLLTASNDSNAKQGSLLLQLRQFSLVEIPQAVTEMGICTFRANLYMRSANGYQLINSIDTAATCKAIDITKKLLAQGKEIIYSYIAKNIATPVTDSTLYSFEDIIQIDSIEKSKTKLYTTTTYADGVYRTFKSFEDQEPDYTDAKIKMKDSVTIDNIKMTDNTTGELTKIKPQAVYAVVVKGKLFAATEYGYYSMYKSKADNDFYFTGNLRMIPSYGDMTTGYLVGGLLGAIATSNMDGYFYTRIDHVNGRFIRIEQLPDNDDYKKYPDLSE
jgi:hypothetical protein